MSAKFSKVIIAEDEAMIMIGFKLFLQQLGYEVIGEACDGETAVSLCKTLNPDFLIMDIKMPGLDGIQALERINHGRKKNLPCIFITAHSDPYLISRAKHVGAFSYLIKPITLESLRAAIDIALQRYEDYCRLQDKLEQSKTELEERKIIERAKGVLMDQFGMKEKQAFEFLQKKSKENNKKMIQIARGILEMDEAMSND